MENMVISRATRSSQVALALAAVVIAVLVAAPWWGRTADLRLITEIMYYLALATTWNLLAGYAGLLSIGQHAYVGLGGYVLFIVTLSLGLNPLLAIPIAGVVGAVLALPVAWIVFRLKGPYFAIGTWVVAEVFRLTFAQMSSVGGGSGLSLPIEAMKSIGSKSERELWIYFLALAVCLGAVLMAYLLLRSRIGLALMAIRDNDVASSSLGIQIGVIKLATYVVAGACTAMWILLHDDLADPAASDPVLRQSTRVRAAAVSVGQTSIDPDVVEAWLGPAILEHPMIPQAVGEASIAAVRAGADRYRPLYLEFSPINHVDGDDPPLFMTCSAEMDLPARDPGHGLHHPLHGVKLREKSAAVGHECHLVVPGWSASTQYTDGTQFLLDKLLSKD